MKIRRRKKKDKHRWPECEGDGRRFQTGQKMDQDICCISKRAIGWRERTSCKSNIWHDTIRLRDVQCSAALATWSAISHISRHTYTHTIAQSTFLELVLLRKGSILLFARFGLWQPTSWWYIVCTWVQVHPSQYLMRRPNYSRARAEQRTCAPRDSRRVGQTDRQRGGERCNVWAGYNVLTGSRTYHE